MKNKKRVNRAGILPPQEVGEDRTEAKSNGKKGQVNKDYDRLLHGPKPGTSIITMERKGRAGEANT